MERRSIIFFLCFLAVVLVNINGAEAYKNYTVGDSLGWYDNLEEPKVNYQKWADGKNFSLGDFLIFNTDKNHSVVQSYNETTYKRCNYIDAEEDDTTDWTAGEPSYDKVDVSIPVPLVKEGLNYFFSGFYDGEQCHHGQRFKINVTHGQGLPESLRTDTAPAPTSPDDGGGVPDTNVPANFDHPKDDGVSSDAVKPTSGAGGDFAGLLRRCRRFNVVLILFAVLGLLG